MPADRFFISAALNTKNVTIEGEEFHHLAHVMRIRVGELMELVNGKGEKAQAELLFLDKKKAELKIVSYEKEPPSTHSLILAQALPRLSALEWIIEKGTELGVTEFWIFPGERSEKKEITPTQMHRLHTMMIHALKQCGRLFLPQLIVKPSLSQWEPPIGSLFFGDLSPQALRLKGPFSYPVTLFIGPEKGLSPSEIEQLLNFGARGISLHANILRVETAAVTALGHYFLCSHP